MTVDKYLFVCITICIRSQVQFWFLVQISHSPTGWVCLFSIFPKIKTEIPSDRCLEIDTQGKQAASWTRIILYVQSESFYASYMIIYIFSSSNLQTKLWDVVIRRLINYGPQTLGAFVCWLINGLSRHFFWSLEAIKCTLRQFGGAFSHMYQPLGPQDVNLSSWCPAASTGLLQHVSWTSYVLPVTYGKFIIIVIRYVVKWQWNTPLHLPYIQPICYMTKYK